MNPFALLLKSRKFWLMFFDAGCSTIFMLATIFYPEREQLIRNIVMLWQPVIIFLIIGITVEDAARSMAARVS